MLFAMKVSEGIGGQKTEWDVIVECDNSICNGTVEVWDGIGPYPAICQMHGCPRCGHTDCELQWHGVDGNAWCLACERGGEIWGSFRSAYLRRKREGWVTPPREPGYRVYTHTGYVHHMADGRFVSHGRGYIPIVRGCRGRVCPHGCGNECFPQCRVVSK